MAVLSLVNRSVLLSYCNLMEELKLRHAIVMKILTDAKERRFTLPPFAAGDLCYVQLRKICELIALGCLLVHGDIPGTRTQKMRKASAADWIINRLSEINPSFYPLPGIQKLDKAGKLITIEPNSKPYLTKPDLLTLYVECGAKLHRGTLGDILKARGKPSDFVRILKWSAKITQLLNFHRIPLAGGQHEIWVTMDSLGDGKVRHEVMIRVPDEI